MSGYLNKRKQDLDIKIDKRLKDNDGLQTDWSLYGNYNNPGFFSRFENNEFSKSLVTIPTLPLIYLQQTIRLILGAGAGLFLAAACLIDLDLPEAQIAMGEASTRTLISLYSGTMIGLSLTAEVAALITRSIVTLLGVDPDNATNSVSHENVSESIEKTMHMYC